jgi:hypothetical protein
LDGFLGAGRDGWGEGVLGRGVVVAGVEGCVVTGVAGVVTGLRAAARRGAEASFGGAPSAASRPTFGASARSARPTGWVSCAASAAGSPPVPAAAKATANAIAAAAVTARAGFNRCRIARA